MDDGNRPIAGKMRMRLALRHSSMRRPARGGNRHRGKIGERFRIHPADFSYLLRPRDIAIDLPRNAPGIVAAILQVLESAHNDPASIHAFPHVSEDSAHIDEV